MGLNEGLSWIGVPVSIPDRSRQSSIILRAQMCPNKTIRKLTILNNLRQKHRQLHHTEEKATPSNLPFEPALILLINPPTISSPSPLPAPRLCIPHKRIIIRMLRRQYGRNTMHRPMFPLILIEWDRMLVVVRI